jgi:membrane associated rhomboid family serine protease
LALPYRWQWRVERWKNAMRGFFGGSKEPPRPKLCPACGALVGITATRCHECGSSLRFSLAALSKGLSGLIGGVAPVTTALLIVNILMFGVSWVATTSAGGGGGLHILWGMNGQVLDRLGATNPRAMFLGNQWYRLITAMFLHGGIIHIGFNMMVLMDVGPIVEEIYGSARYLFLYVTTGVFGYMLSSLIGYNSVGASGALMGLIGLLIAITTRRGGAAMKSLRSKLISWVVIIFALGFFMGGVDNAAHFGGLVSGFGFGKLFVDREPMTASEHKRAYALGWLAGLTVIASYVLLILHLVQTRT